MTKNLDLARRTTGTAHPIDIYVGAQIKLRRTSLGLSQESLGKDLNLTFQQVQKYERGANRVGASRLYELAQALGVTVSYFYEGMPDGLGAGSQGEDAELSRACAEGSVLARSETMRLVTHYYAIRNPAHRTAAYNLIKALAVADGT